MQKIELDSGMVEIDLGNGQAFELDIYGTYSLFFKWNNECHDAARAESGEGYGLAAHDAWVERIIAHVRDLSGGIELNKTQADRLYRALESLNQKKIGWSIPTNGTPKLPSSTAST